MGKYYSDSYVVKCEHRDGKADDEEYFDNQYDAAEYFSSLNDPDDEAITGKYGRISLERIDWNNRAGYNIDGVEFDE